MGTRLAIWGLALAFGVVLGVLVLGGAPWVRQAGADPCAYPFAYEPESASLYPKPACRNLDDLWQRGASNRVTMVADLARTDRIVLPQAAMDQWPFDGCATLAALGAHPGWRRDIDSLSAIPVLTEALLSAGPNPVAGDLFAAAEMRPHRLALEMVLLGPNQSDCADAPDRVPLSMDLEVFVVQRG